MTVSTQSLSEVLDHLRHGVFDKSVVDFLERHKGIDLVSELRLTYPITFQERRIGDKWEVALAKRVGTEMATRNIQNSLFVSLALLDPSRLYQPISPLLAPLLPIMFTHSPT